MADSDFECDRGNRCYWGDNFVSSDKKDKFLQEYKIVWNLVLRLKLRNKNK
jgi:hypothetical protein